MKEVRSGNTDGIVPSLILVEFYYKTWEKFGEQAAQVRTISLREDLLEVVDIRENDVFEIGKLKVKHPQLSLADAVLISTAKQTKGGTILTTDQPIKDTNQVKTIKFRY